ncbi:MAG: 7-cyano-7-deazaguanine synthase [Nostocaceae cyanobacterium]|nr:7-cyano-7-deazaguanine synthase [Nostocaceae cyanobacterium]
MTTQNTFIHSLGFILPRFLREDYSPYQCHVAVNGINYNLRTRRIHLQNQIKTWINTGKNPFLKPVECKTCLFDTRIPNIYIGADGICNMCMTYKKNFKQEILDSELETFLNTPREEGAKVDAVVGFSGGKDSAVSLITARQKLGLEVTAVLVQNGFIPEQVIENGRKLCDKLGVELVVLNIDLAPYVKDMMEHKFKNGYPCYKCGDMFYKEIQNYCIEHHINRIIMGRNWWHWIEPEVRSTKWLTDEKTGMKLQIFSLPFVLQLTEKDIYRILDEVGWSTVKIHGNSTNCVLPGLVEYMVSKRLGYHPELQLLSREVITGFLDKEEAKHQLSDIKDNTATLEKLVNKKLEEIENRKVNK